MYLSAAPSLAAPSLHFLTGPSTHLTMPFCPTKYLKKNRRLPRGKWTTRIPGAWEPGESPFKGKSYLLPPCKVTRNEGKREDPQAASAWCRLAHEQLRLPPGDSVRVTAHSWPLHTPADCLSVCSGDCEPFSHLISDLTVYCSCSPFVFPVSCVSLLYASLLPVL